MNASCRVQLHAGFTFDDLIGILDLLAALGFDAVYTSPALQALPGSTHGYDVVDHGRINEELGGVAGHERLSRALEARGMARILDLVPNHMAIGPLNRWWWDVLENGRSSRYATYFDVDWSTAAVDRILLPILGEPYGRALEGGLLGLSRRGSGFVVTYFEHEAPLDPATVAALLDRAARAVGSDMLGFLADGLASLPPIQEPRRRHRNKEVLRALLGRLLTDDPVVAGAVDEALATAAGDADTLHALLELQHHRLAFWRVGRQELDYRRFFDITGLVGLRVEDPEVFEETHALVLDAVRRGEVHGLRIDHPDGLRDPEGYLRALRELAPDLYLVVEKILEPGEELPETWPVDGTTGYDFLGWVQGLFVDPQGEEPLTRTWRALSGFEEDWLSVVRSRKRRAMAEGLGSELNRLTDLFVALCGAHRSERDHARRDLARAIRATVACFPVYRTYVASGRVSEPDRAAITSAIAAAREDEPQIDGGIFDFLRGVLLLEVPGHAAHGFALSFQQTTGPVMAKGVEDTAFYVYNRLVALNEVGGDPGRFAVPVEAFHAWMGAHRHPRGMRALSTHDTKRSEDVRARIVLLSEIPERWGAAARRLIAAGEPYESEGAPDRNLVFHLLQVWVGAWPLPLERALRYAEKAAREAKAHTSWSRPDERFEEALHRWVRGVHADEGFQRALRELAEPLVRPGRINALAQLVLQLFVPGLPDRYQGTEIWAPTLVDPDNRGAVDWDLRRRLLAELEQLDPADIAARWDDGGVKLHVLRTGLAVRARRAGAMLGSYRPVRARGRHADRVVAFARGDEVLVVAPRLLMGLTEGWGDTAIDLPSGRWASALDRGVWGGAAHLDALLGVFPIAILERGP